ncbi:hypothetical protein [Kocuria sp.]|uniref:hypothetical protein n=1 Tax=Kocuria sp. TaxID=1871328 RepID=UPI0026DC67E6|nr:hypothetical protein [Kocuria sp.]MDO4919246.1 hypothetical protein [Kocuria sp.]
MGFLGEYRATRRDERELGEGVWRRAHDRFKRGLDRYHQILESVRAPELRAAAVPVANELADLLPRVRAVCMEAHLRAPSQNQDIPHSTAGYLSDVHRQLSRAGNAMAQAAEALTMARFAVSGSAAAPFACPADDAAGSRSADPSPTRRETSDAPAADRPGAVSGHPESPSAGTHSIRRRRAVVEEYVAAAEALMTAHAPRRG